jgi:hypothetical protein
VALPRVVAAEMLDGLAPGDPAAIRSRRDLRRVHRAMGTRGIVLRGLRSLLTTAPRMAPLRVLELGAGDGTLMLGVARAAAAEWPPVELTLLDRQDLLDRATVSGYAAAGWRATSAVVDVLDWAATEPDWLLEADRPGGRWDLIVANLFLHHFDAAPLQRLLAAVARRADRFFACEPHRAGLALAGSHLIGALGANAVTREDAVLSVHAGFRGRELSALWPGDGGWDLAEYPAGLFSHCFSACRLSAGAGSRPQ